MKDSTVTWDEDLIAEGTTRFDPETLAQATRPAHKGMPRQSDLLATGERVEQFQDVLVAGARKLPSLEGTTFDRVENGRWIVGTFTRGNTVRVVDGLTRTLDPKMYVAVHGDLAVSTDPTYLDATVTNMLTHTTVLQAVCADSTDSWSLSSRFLWCESSGAGPTGFDLHTGARLDVGLSARMSPDESYLVRVPGAGEEGTLISADHVEWTSAHTRRTVIVTKDVPPATDKTQSYTSTVPFAFCGDGQLFAIVTRRDLVIHRGSDAKQLASARAMPGGSIAFSRSGRYILFTRAGAATVYRLDP
jgi:hypothetical protein